MGFNSNKTVVVNNDDARTSSEDKKVSAPQYDNQLLPIEIEFLLGSVKVATFTGSQVEVVYNTIIKLQNQYIQKTQK